MIVCVIDSTYSNERKLMWLLTELGEETFMVPVDEWAHETWLHCQERVDSGSGVVTTS